MNVLICVLVKTAEENYTSLPKAMEKCIVLLILESQKNNPTGTLLFLFSEHIFP